MMNEARHQDTGRLALAIGVAAAGSAACLATYFAVGGPFGTINDIGNAAAGVLSAALAWQLRRQIPGRAADLAVGAAIVGAGLTVAGSTLVVSDTTGFFFAGLVSSVGFAGIGAWLVVLNRSDAMAAFIPRSASVARHRRRCADGPRHRRGAGHRPRARRHGDSARLDVDRAHRLARDLRRLPGVGVLAGQRRDCARIARRSPCPTGRARSGLVADRAPAHDGGRRSCSARRAVEDARSPPPSGTGRSRRRCAGGRGGGRGGASPTGCRGRAPTTTGRRTRG